jgi:hypothetical protein
MMAGTTSVRRRLGGVTLVVAPALLVAGAMTHPREVSDASEQLGIVASSLNRWYLAHLLYVMAMALLIPAVLTLGRRLRERAPRLELWGTGLAVVGLCATAGLVVIEGFGGWQLAQLSDRQAASHAFDHITHSAGILVPFAVVGVALSAGLVILAVGLLRTATAPAWMGWTLGAGAGLLAIGLAAELHTAFLAGVVAIAAALGAAGVEDLGLEVSSRTLATSTSAPLVAGN